MHDWGISKNTLDRTLSRIARPLEFLRRETSVLRNVDNVMAYKPSILRQFPCIRFGFRNRYMMAPIPDLIMDRVTNGLFYDIIGGGGIVRDEVGRNFEIYCIELLKKMLIGSTFAPETTYRTRLGAIATPDILKLDESGAVDIAIECKATRMSVTARFGETPEEDRGYEEIAKGVMQLWRFFAHCRQNLIQTRLSADVQGLILTLDEWFAGRTTIVSQIIARANQLADSSAHEVPLIDRRPIAFCTVSELEVVLATATSASLKETIRIGSVEKVGWIFPILHDETTAEKSQPKDYPFESELCELLPWFARASEEEMGPP